MNLDCAAQLKTGTLCGFGKKGHVTTQIMHANACVWIFLHFDAMIDGLDESGHQFQVASEQAMSTLKKYAHAV